jgi:hypothetical protein
MQSRFPITRKYIETYGKSVESEIKKRLKGHDKYASGKLYESIRFIMKETPKDFTLDFTMLDYGKYVDKGVKGSKTNKAGNTPYKYTNKMPPTKVFDKWILRKGLAPRDKKGKFLNRDRIKFAIARSIFLHGVAPTNFFTIPTTRRAKQFEAGVGNAMAQDLDKMI